ncbi:MAG: sugar porter family MFS transporter [Myxococcaceae bacterium]
MALFKSIYFVSGLAAIAGLLFGYDTGIISGAILFIRKDFDLSPTQVGLVVSAVLLGALIGSAFCSRITDRLGRRGSLMIASGLFVLASLGAAMAQNAADLMFARLFLGIAIGISSLTAPLYLAEVAPAKIRGFLVSLNQLAVTIGILSAYGVNYLLSSEGSWRLMFMLGAVPGGILGLALFFLPESPRWMALRGQKESSKAILDSLRTGEDTQTEMLEIEQSITTEKGSFASLFTPAVKPALIISIGLAFFQQVTGINTIIYYAPTIFEHAGFGTASHAILASICIGITNVIFTLISLPLIDRVGRRPLLIIGVTGMFMSLALCGVAFGMTDIIGMRWVALFCVLGYIAFFAISLGPIMWLMISEVFPLQQRGLGTSLAVCAQWGFNMIVSSTFPSLLHEAGSRFTFWIYASMCLVGLIFVIKKVPETKGKVLEEIRF